ncbi:hypothetical protein CR513_13300, partial [Mucuna pruriens]
MPPQGNSPSLEDLMKVPAKYELQQYAVPAKHECHHPRPQDANRIARKHYEPFTIDQVWQPTLINNSESKGECECSNSENRYRLIPTLSQMLTHKYLRKRSLSHCHFQLELLQQGNMNMMKSY